MEFGMTPRRHNPVDSICRKLQTIQRRDREPNSPFQIPKLQSNSYDSPHTGLRRNLDTILKKRKGDAEQNGSPIGLTPGSSRGSGRTPCVPVTPLSPVNTTYTITGMLGTMAEKGSVAPGHNRAWQLSCSTPAIQNGDACFSFTPSEKQRSKAPAHSLLSYNLNFCSSDASTILDCELPYPALVVKRLSMGDGASLPSESRKESLAEVSLICEEDLLDTIFQACDTQCRGKVYVSHIVDYLRHTTSRSSEDSGLEELCNMLDPEHKDISIDLDTYHAIMKEWIEDCRNQDKDGGEDVTQESVKLPDNFSAKRSFLLNMTSGSLEAFGGEASRAELETSDLVFCVADLQFYNQKLQEEVRKLKQAVEVMEDTNQKLLEENEELKTQAKTGQQLLQKERMLKEEVEEMKLTLSSSEENRARASAQSKQMERENQSLISQISSLQVENTKISMEVDELQKKMKTLYELNADLQAQTHSFDTAMSEKDTFIQEKMRQIEELKAAVMEYSSVTELLRAEKSKLESQMQLLQPDVAIPGLSLSVAYRLNQTSSGSLETELALAQQNPPEGAEHLSSICLASPLDETLDREVLLLLQGPTPEQMSVEFKILINRLRREFKEDTLEVLAALDPNTEPKLQDLRVQLEQRRREWSHGLEQLKQYTDSLEKELLKMASNMRRSRTEILHLSVRLQEQENHKLLLHEELEHLKTGQDRRDASSQTDPPHVHDSTRTSGLLRCYRKIINNKEVVDEEQNSSPEWDRVFPLLDSPSEEETAELETHEQEDVQKQPAAHDDDDEEEEEEKDEELQEGLSKMESLQETCCGEDGKQELDTPTEMTTNDSGVESEQLGGTSVSQESQPESVACGENSVSGLISLLSNSSTAANHRLYNCDFSDEGCALTSALRSNPSHLRELDLSENKIRDSGVKCLSAVLENPHCKLETLRLNNCDISDEGCAALTSALRSNPSHLRELILSGNKLRDSAVKCLSAVLENPHCNLETLRLCDCGVSNEGCAALTSALRSNPSHLRELDLSWSTLGDSGVKCLSAVLENPHCKLETLRLCNCDVTDEGCAALTSALRSNPLHVKLLGLSGNKVRDSGVKCLSAVLENPHCKVDTLGLCDCDISDEGCAALTSALRSNPSHLRELDLSLNKLRDSGVKCLSAVLENPHCKLETLRLCNCGVSDEGCAALISALRSNPSHLRELNLFGNKLTDSEKEQLFSLELQNIRL